MLPVSILTDVLPKRAMIQFKPREVNPRTYGQYNESAWGRQLRDPAIRNPLSTKGKLFRRRFRVPYPVFEEILGKLHLSNTL